MIHHSLVSTMKLITYVTVCKKYLLIHESWKCKGLNLFQQYEHFITIIVHLEPIEPVTIKSDLMDSDKT